jgi:Holliday junction resolvase RusA-like endonuclease
MSNTLLPIKLRLPLPPVLNRYWAFPRRLTRPVVTKIGDTYQGDVAASLWSHFDGKPPQFKGRLRIDVGVMHRDRRLPDLDNFWKALLDSLEHAGLVENDKQFRDSRIHDIGVQSPGWINIVIESADDLPLFRGQ